MQNSGYIIPELQEMGEVCGGSPYGASAMVGNGSRQPSEKELTIARFQGKNVSRIAAKMFG